ALAGSASPAPSTHDGHRAGSPGLGRARQRRSARFHASTPSATSSSAATTENAVPVSAPVTSAAKTATSETTAVDPTIQPARKPQSGAMDTGAASVIRITPYTATGETATARASGSKKVKVEVTGTPWGSEGQDRD